MRDYALIRAHSFDLAAPASGLGRIIANWRARREVARLDGFDDFLLRDIGVTREEVRWAAGLPLSVNAAMALEERALRRQRSGR